MVESEKTLLDLSPWTHIGLRYFCLVPRQNSSMLWLIARGGSATHDATEESQYATFLLSTAARRRNPAIIMRDPSISRNMVVKLGPDKRYHAFGGHDLRSNGVPEERRDGIYHLHADNFLQLQAEVWTNRPTNLALNIFNGQHAGCVTPRSNGVCEFDGKVGAAWLAGTWYVFVRANVKLNGGRYVYVTKSTDGPAGPYGCASRRSWLDFRMLALPNILRAFTHLTRAPHSPLTTSARWQRLEGNLN
ncbi:hypothetical protein AB1Y20_015823 [Prymnesium parvum]|uniref:Uncharacterized protein n=1 Tax=Prymnesium parvum TaxID=97485 RepID=A0AB34K244_PRYPA